MRYIYIWKSNCIITLIISTLVVILAVQNEASAEDVFEVRQNDALLSFGGTVHATEGGKANGLYISGMYFYPESNIGLMGRAEYILSKYKTGNFQSINLAIGLGYAITQDVIPYFTVGQCFSSYLTCYFNDRNPPGTPASVDYYSIYFGSGLYYNIDFLNSMFDLGIDYSPYKNYNARGLYFGYVIKF